MSERRLTRSSRAIGNDCDPQRSHESRQADGLAPTYIRDTRQDFDADNSDSGILTRANNGRVVQSSPPRRRGATKEPNTEPDNVTEHRPIFH